MRKLFCMVLILCCLFGIVGCASDPTVPENSAVVYYQREKATYGADDSVIGATYLDTEGRGKDYVFLLNKYFHTIPGEGFTSVFPKGVSLKSFKLEGLTATVILSDKIADLTGMELTIALTCLTKTVMSVTGCHEVIISAYSKQLDGQKFITLNRDRYLLVDNSGIPEN